MRTWANLVHNAHTQRCRVWYLPRMPLRLLFTLCAALYLASSGLSQHSKNPTPVAPGFEVETLSDSAVQVEVTDPQGGTERGSGFWVSPELIATCNHVVPSGIGMLVKVKIAIPSLFDLERNTYIYSNWIVHEGKVVAIDSVNDLALIRTMDFSSLLLKQGPLSPRIHLPALNTSLPKALSDAFLVGFPLGNPYVVVQHGTTAAVAGRLNIAGLPGDSKLLFSTVANPGNSGGPIFDSKGQVIAVLEGALPSVRNAPSAVAVSGLAVGIPAFYVQRLLGTLANHPPK